MRRSFLATLLVASAAAFTVATVVVPARAAAPLPVTYDWVEGYLGNIANADQAPPGAITYDADGKLAACSRPGRLPVILVHGTWENQYDNWAAAAPLLSNAGLCVYTFNYGGSPGDVLGAYGPIADSAGQLGVFVDRVRAATGSTQVDLVGHSQGGMMPRYYIKFGNSFTGGSFGVGTSKIRRLVALSPSNHGTTLNDIATLGEYLGVNELVAQVQPAAIDQTIGSAFMKKLDTCPGGRPSADVCAGDPVRYTVIQTAGDEIVTPSENAFLMPNPAAKGSVVNIDLQDSCPLDWVEHLAIPFDSHALGLVLRALGVADPAAVPGASPSCKFIAPFVGG